MSDYLDAVYRRLWRYQAQHFPDSGEMFSNLTRNQEGPPVFKPQHADCNVVAPRKVHADVVRTVPRSRRHRWFGSMRSSQALTQSVFGTLMVMDKLALLSGVCSDEGEPAFFTSSPARGSCHLEHACITLGELKDRETQSDVYFDGALPISVECKFSEDEFGACSQTRLKPDAHNFTRDFCDGAYAMKPGRKERCPLSAKGILYWQKIPMAFQWRQDVDYQVCPIAAPYQLVRNVLAADQGHALVVYDQRNPAFGAEGECARQWSAVRTNLLDPSRLRRCSWQRILKALEQDSELDEFTTELRDKYGL